MGHATRIGSRIKDVAARLIAIEDLEEASDKALEWMEEVQAKKKEDFDAKLLKIHGIKVGGMVLLFNNCHKDF